MKIPEANIPNPTVPAISPAYMAGIFSASDMDAARTMHAAAAGMTVQRNSRTAVLYVVK